MKQNLSEECVRFVVQTLACDLPPLAVARAANLQYMAGVSEDEVRLYDPTLNLSPDHINPNLIRLFAATREFYTTGLNTLIDERAAGRATREERLVMLQDALDKVVDADQPCVVMEILEQAAKESNDWYEDKDHPSIRDAALIRLVTLSWDREDLLNLYQGDDL